MVGSSFNMLNLDIFKLESCSGSYILNRKQIYLLSLADDSVLLSRNLYWSSVKWPNSSSINLHPLHPSL
jgi:hypothetical protein